MNLDINNSNGISNVDATSRGSGKYKTAQEIETWLVQHISQNLLIDPSMINPELDFNSYGISSKDAILLSGDLEEWLDRRINPTIVYEYPSIRLLAEHLAFPESPMNQPEQKTISDHNNFDIGIEQDLDAKVTRLEQLSEEEAELLLMRRITAHGKKL